MESVVAGDDQERQKTGTAAGVLGLGIGDRQNRGGGPRSNGQRRHRWATLSFQGGHLSPYANTHHSDTPANGPDTLSDVHSGMAQTGGEL